MNLGQNRYSSASDTVTKISCSGAGSRAPPAPARAWPLSQSLSPFCPQNTLVNRHARHQLSVESRSDQLDLVKAVLAHGKDVDGIGLLDDRLALQGQGVGLIPVQIAQKGALLHPE